MNRYVAKVNPIVQSSADVICTLVNEMIHPKSVLDVGSGVGAWSKAFLKLGITDILATDMAYHVPNLVIPRDKFQVEDLTKDFSFNRRWDLSICLEVAEHLSKNRAKPLVKLLTESSDYVLFSASIPHQGGGVHHVNEQWQSYWANLFKDYGYFPLDFRASIWNDKRILWFYRQNIFLYTKENNFSALPLDIVHPEAFNFTFKRVAGILLSKAGLI